MKHLKFFFTFLVALLAGANVNVRAAVGDTFTATSTEGVSVTYMVLTESGSTGTVQVGIGNYDNPAVSASTTETVTIPETVANGSINYTVTSLSQAAFYCVHISYINLPNTLTSIGIAAFGNCWIKSIHIPASVTEIKWRAFYSCPYLNSITVDTNNTVYDSHDDCNAIIEKSTRTLVAGSNNTIIPSDVLIIGEAAFGSRISLKSVTLPEGLTTIGQSAFGGCYGLTSINIPSSVTSIGKNAFERCINLTSITIPSSVNEIGDYAFAHCYKLKTFTCNKTTPPTLGKECFKEPCIDAILYVPEGCVDAYYQNSDWAYYFDNIRVYGDTSFGRGNKFTAINNQGVEVTYMVTSMEPNTVKTYGYKDYYNNYIVPAIPSDYQGSLVIPETVTYDNMIFTVTGIGRESFDSENLNLALTDITLPSTTTSIGDYAFVNCSSLESLTCNSTTPPTLVYNSFYNYATNAMLFVPEGYVSDYQNSNWAYFFNRIREIGDTSFGVGDTFTAANDQGVNITYMVTGPSTVKTYGYWDDANDCAVTAIPSNYQGALTIPETATYQSKTYTVTEIGEESFDDYNLNLRLTEVTLPSTITAIGYDAFWSDNGITCITVLATEPPQLEDWAFSSTNTTLYVPEGCVSDYQESDWAQYFSNIKVIGDVSVEMGETFVQALQDFKDSNLSVSLTYMITTVPNGDQHGTVQIGTGSWACGNPEMALFNLIIPETVTYQTLTFDVIGIAPYAFNGFAGSNESGNIGLETIYIPASVTRIGQSAFQGCSVLTDVYSLAVTPPTLYADAFLGIGSNTILHVPEGSNTSYQYSDWSNYFSYSNIVEMIGGKIKIAGVDILDGVPYNNGNGVSVIWDNYYNSPIITLNNVNLTYDAGPAIEINTYDKIDIYLVGDNVVSSTAPNCAAISIGTKDGEDTEGCYVIIGKVSEGYYYEPIDYVPASLTIPANASMGIYSHSSTIRMADITADIAGKQYGVYVKGTYEMGIANAPRRAQGKDMALLELRESTDMNISGGTAAFMAETGVNWGVFDYYNKLKAWQPTGDMPELEEYDEGLVTFLVGNTPATSLHFGHDYFVRYTTEGIPMKFTILDEYDKTCQVYGSYEDNEMIESIPEYYKGPLTIPETIDYNGETYTVTKIANYAFINCDITSAVIPATVTEIENFAFGNCYHLQAIVCLPTTPPIIGVKENTYNYDLNIDVYVPYGCKKKYVAQGDEGWLKLSYIDEIIMLEKGQTNITTIEAEDVFTTDYASDMTDDYGDALDLEDAVAGGVYYNLKSDAGEGYDTEEECIVINNTTSEDDMEAIVSQGFDNESHQAITDNFSGLIIQVNGKGNIEIACKTLGTGQLTVRIGDGDPIPYITQEEKTTISVSFDVTEPTCIYIYASEVENVAPSANSYCMDGARRNNSNTEDNSVKIYQLSVVNTFGFTISDQATDGIDNYATIADLGKGYFKVVGDVEIYNLTVDKNRLVFSAPFVENDIIKGEEAYLVIGEPGTYTFTAVKPTEEQINAIPNNENMLFSTGDGRGNSGYSLTAEDMAAAHFEGTKFYKLSIYNNKIGFFWGADKGAAFNYTKPHKAYLAVPPESISNSQSISGFFFDDTTDIREVQGESVAEDATYSISGIRLDGKKLSKGIYIINGKKVVVK